MAHVALLLLYSTFHITLSDMYKNEQAPMTRIKHVGNDATRVKANCIMFYVS